MEQTQLFLFGFVILAFTAIGTITYQYAKIKQQQQEDQQNPHYANWGN